MKLPTRDEIITKDIELVLTIFPKFRVGQAWWTNNYNKARQCYQENVYQYIRSILFYRVAQKVRAIPQI